MDALSPQAFGDSRKRRDARSALEIWSDMFRSLERDKLGREALFLVFMSNLNWASNIRRSNLFGRAGDKVGCLRRISQLSLSPSSAATGFRQISASPVLDSLIRLYHSRLSLAPARRPHPNIRGQLFYLPDNCLNIFISTREPLGEFYVSEKQQNHQWNYSSGAGLSILNFFSSVSGKNENVLADRSGRRDFFLADHFQVNHLRSRKERVLSRRPEFCHFHLTHRTSNFSHSKSPRCLDLCLFIFNNTITIK